MTTVLILLSLAAFYLFGLSAIFRSTMFARRHFKYRAYRWWSASLDLLVDCTGGNRSALKPLRSQLNDGVFITVQMVGAGAAIMTPGDGDPKSLWWAAVTRQAQGKFTLTTKDPWMAFDYLNANYGAATLTNFWVVNFGIPSQNANNTWSVTVQFYSAAGGAAPALTDPIASDIVWFGAVLRNSTLNP